MKNAIKLKSIRKSYFLCPVISYATQKCCAREEKSIILVIKIM